MVLKYTRNRGNTTDERGQTNESFHSFNENCEKEGNEGEN